MKFINVTPHPITIKNSVVNITVEPCGICARVESRVEKSSVIAIAGICTVARKLGKVDFGGLEPEPNTVYIVSSMVLDNIPADSIWAGCVVAPDTGSSAERNANGHIISVCQLVSK